MKQPIHPVTVVWQWMKVMAFAAFMGLLLFLVLSAVMHVWSIRSTVYEDRRMAERIFDKECRLAANALTRVCREQAEVLALDPWQQVLQLSATKIVDDLAQFIPFGTLCRQAKDKACLIVIAHQVQSLLSWSQVTLWTAAVIILTAFYKGIRSIVMPFVYVTTQFLEQSRTPIERPLVRTSRRQRARSPMSIEEVVEN